MKTLKTTLSLIVMLFIGAHALAQSTIRGKVVEADTGDGLPGASVVVGTSTIGTATDYNGDFAIRGVQGNQVTISISFIGFETKTIQVDINSADIDIGSIELTTSIASLETIIVRGSLEGQQKALNQQYSADNIKNIVSADLIGRFPDLNVAEALQRVPGVNISRARGEGSTVSLRGTPAHFTAININGEQIPSTQNGGARNESLDLIPADQLASMEVVKAIMPDMDGDAIGGSINLRTPTAKSTNLQLKAEAGGGYNSLSQSYNAIGRFKVGKRFLDANDPNGKLGVLLGFSYFETDNEEDKSEATWSSFGGIPIESLGIDSTVINTLDFQDLVNQRTRMGATFTLDYEFSNKSDIIFNFMYSRRSDIDARNRLRLFLDQSPGAQWTSLDSVRDTEIRRDASFRDYFSENLSYNLEGEHTINNIVVDWGLYYADSRRVEDAIDGRFDRGADNRIDMRVTNAPDLGIYTTFPQFETYNSEFGLHDPFTINEISRYDITDATLESDNAVAKVNVLVPYQLRDARGSFKAGVKIRRQSNNRRNVNDIFQFSDPNNVLDPRQGFASVIGDDEDEDFLDGNQRFGPSISEDKFRTFVEENENLFVFDRVRSNRNTFNSTYETVENIVAAYAMSRLQFSKLMLLAGLRYETNRVDYDAFEVNNVTGNSTPLSDGTTYDFFLPNLHVKYGLDRLTNLRGALTWSYARANFNDIVPFLAISEDGTNIRSGNSELRPGSAINVDILAERYFGTVGILSGGLFYKRINDFQFTRNIQALQPGQPFYDEFPGFKFEQEQNGDKAEVYGFELNSQVTLDFLPGLLKGIGLYFNYTFTESDASTDDRSGLSLEGQAKHTWNGAVSFDYRNFSAKASANFNGAFLTAVSNEDRNDIFQKERLQLDINASYQFLDHFRVFAEFLNVTNAPSIQYQGIEERISEYAYFGWWNRFGLSYNLN